MNQALKFQDQFFINLAAFKRQIQIADSVNRQGLKMMTPSAVKQDTVHNIINEILIRLKAMIR